MNGDSAEHDLPFSEASTRERVHRRALAVLMAPEMHLGKAAKWAAWIADAALDQTPTEGT